MNNSTKPTTKIGRQVKKQNKSFIELTNEFALPIAVWQHKKPAKRNAFLLFHDDDAGRWCTCMLGNNRAKYPMATVVKGLSSAMIKTPELYGWICASVRCVERELKKLKKEAKQKADSHGKDRL